MLFKLCRVVCKKYKHTKYKFLNLVYCTLVQIITLQEGACVQVKKWLKLRSSWFCVIYFNNLLSDSLKMKLNVHPMIVNRIYFVRTTHFECVRFPGCKPLADLGGAAGAPSPQTEPYSFVFAYVFAKKCPHRRSAPPNEKSWIRNGKLCI